MVDLQKASIQKRFAAWLIDTIFVAVLAVGIGYLLSVCLGYDAYSNTVAAGYDKYETQYGIVFDISIEEYEAMDEQMKANYDAAYDALIADDAVMQAYNMAVSLILLIITLSIFFGVLIWEFIIPLFFKNGRTIGKAVFALGVMHTEGIKLSTFQLFVRAMLGKFTVETMVPLYIIGMIFLGKMGVIGLLVLFAILIMQVVLIISTRTNSLIHDVFACTVVIDFPSQRIFNSTNDLIEYTKRIHAERAARQDY